MPPSKAAVTRKIFYNSGKIFWEIGKNFEVTRNLLALTTSQDGEAWTGKPH